jgi:hypothetical protein
MDGVCLFNPPIPVYRPIETDSPAEILIDNGGKINKIQSFHPTVPSNKIACGKFKNKETEDGATDSDIISEIIKTIKNHPRMLNVCFFKAKSENVDDHKIRHTIVFEQDAIWTIIDDKK